MKLLLQRTLESEKQTLGIMYLLEKNGNIIDSWKSLELPDKGNKKRISRIPEGSYKASKHKSPRFGDSLWLRDVPNRSEILIHKGNFYYDILGCILIGKDLTYINKDKFLDVTDSSKSIEELMQYLKLLDSIMIQIVNNRN